MQKHNKDVYAAVQSLYTHTHMHLFLEKKLPKASLQLLPVLNSHLGYLWERKKNRKAHPVEYSCDLIKENKIWSEVETKEEKKNSIIHRVSLQTKHPKINTHPHFLAWSELCDHPGVWWDSWGLSWI